MNTHSLTSDGKEDIAALVQERAGLSHHILAVDDDGDIRQFCADTLAGSGYRVDTAEDGAAGWEALQANGYHLLITDNSMPKVSGIELVNKLRSAGMTLPVILASGAIPTEVISRNPTLQLAATLLKPFTTHELLNTVEKILRTVEGSRNRPGRLGQVLAIGGFTELTAANVDMFRMVAHAAVDGHKIIEVDLSQTVFMDCRGLGALIALRNLVRDRGGTVRLLRPTPPVHRLIEVTGVGILFEIVLEARDYHSAHLASRASLRTTC